MLIDSHCHLNSFSFSEREDIISLCRSNYILIDSSINCQSALISSDISKKYPFIYSSLGFHPFAAKEYSLNVLETYKNLIKTNKKIVAIGEIGLDEKTDYSIQEQERVFKNFLELAKDNNLAVVIHNRLSNQKILDIINDFFSSYEKIVFHCFSYSTDFLRKILVKRGFVSFSLNVLRKNKEVIDSLKECPLSNLLLETDSPYMKINNRQSNPLDIKEVYSFVSFIKKVEEKELEEAVFSNIKKLFVL
jgi:TatD DNase family protein